MDNISINLCRQVNSGSRGRYSGDRGICLVHDGNNNRTCKACNHEKSRNTDEIKKRKTSSGLYTFSISNPSQVPILFNAFCVQEDGDCHHPFFANGPGVFDRSGIISGVLTFEKSHQTYLVEHDDHEVLVVKQEGVAGAYRYRKQFVDRACELFGSNDAVHHNFTEIAGLGYSDARHTVKSTLRMYYTFTPLYGNHCRTKIIGQPIQIDRRPKKNLHESAGRSRHSSSSSTIITPIGQLATWISPSSAEDLVNIILRVRASRSTLTIEYPLDIPATQNANVRSLLRQRVERKLRAAKEDNDSQHMLENVDSVEEMDVGEQLNDSFDPHESASSLFTPVYSAGFRIDGMCNFRQEPARTLNYMNQASELEESDLTDLCNVLLDNQMDCEMELPKYVDQKSIKTSIEYQFDDDEDFGAFIEKGLCGSKPAEYIDDGGSLNGIEPFNPATGV